MIGIFYDNAVNVYVLFALTIYLGQLERQRKFVYFWDLNNFCML